MKTLWIWTSNINSSNRLLRIIKLWTFKMCKAIRKPTTTLTNWWDRWRWTQSCSQLSKSWWRMPKTSSKRTRKKRLRLKSFKFKFKLNQVKPWIRIYKGVSVIRLLMSSRTIMIEVSKTKRTSLKIRGRWPGFKQLWLRRNRKKIKGWKLCCKNSRLKGKNNYKKV